MVKSDKNHPHPRSFWHERAVLQRSAFGQWTAGNEVVATILISLYLSPLNFSPCFLLRGSFLIKGVLGSKNLFCKSRQTPLAILGPLAAFCDLEDGAALQAMSECPLRR